MNASCNTPRQEQLRTLHGVISTPCQNSSAVHRKHDGASLDTLSVSAFDCHARPHKVRVGLPHVEGAIQTR